MKFLLVLGIILAPVANALAVPNVAERRRPEYTSFPGLSGDSKIEFVKPPHDGGVQAQTVGQYLGGNWPIHLQQQKLVWLQLKDLDISNHPSRGEGVVNVPFIVSVRYEQKPDTGILGAIGVKPNGTVNIQGNIAIEIVDDQVRVSVSHLSDSQVVEIAARNAWLGDEQKSLTEFFGPLVVTSLNSFLNQEQNHAKLFEIVDAHLEPQSIMP